MSFNFFANSNIANIFNITNNGQLTINTCIAAYEGHIHLTWKETQSGGVPKWNRGKQNSIVFQVSK